MKSLRDVVEAAIRNVGAYVPDDFDFDEAPGEEYNDRDYPIKPYGGGEHPYRVDQADNRYASWNNAKNSWRGDPAEPRHDNRGREGRQSYRSQSKIEGITNNASLSLPDYGPEGPTKIMNNPTDLGMNSSGLDPDKIDKIKSLGEEDGSVIHVEVRDPKAGAILDELGWDLARPDPSKSHRDYNRFWVTTKDKWDSLVELLSSHGFHPHNDYENVYNESVYIKRVFIPKCLTEIEIRRLSGDELEPFGDSQVYEVTGDERLTQPVYYVVISPKDGQITISSIGNEGELDNVDQQLIKAFIPVKPEEEGQEGLVYNGDMESILKPLIGNHIAVIQKDLQDLSHNKDDADMHSSPDQEVNDIDSEVRTDIATFDIFREFPAPEFGQDFLGGGGAGGDGSAMGAMGAMGGGGMGSVGGGMGGSDLSGGGGMDTGAAGGLPSGPVPGGGGELPEPENMLPPEAGKEMPNLGDEEEEEGDNEPNGAETDSNEDDEDGKEKIRIV